MRITIYSNAPWTPTGYGTQTAQLARRLRDDGHDLAIASNYGEMARITDWEGIPVYPGGADRYSTDLIERVHRIHDGDLLIGLYDSWVIGEAVANLPAVWWTPIDHDPAPPKVAAFAEKHRIITMSEFGKRTLAKEGIASTLIPHGLDTAAYQPRPSDFRERNGIPADAFLVVINAANQDNSPSRKAWPEMLLALARFMDRRDVWVYLNTDVTRPSGISIPGLIALLGLDAKRIRATDPLDYRLGLTSAEEVAEMYTAGDVLLAASRGEGFGLAVPEAMLCGTPAVVSDFSAQPELVGDTGWKVRWQPEYDAFQGSFWATPYIGSIVAALEAAYSEKGTQSAQDRRSAARAHAAQYDADRVFADHWRPFLAGLERDLSRPARPGNTKAAKRRMARRTA